MAASAPVGGWLTLRIANRTALTDRIACFELVRPEGGELPPFTAGSHIKVCVGDLVRHYSLADDPRRRDRYRIVVLCEANGSGGSARIHADWRAGDVVKASEPLNHFPLADRHNEALLIAGGIGITPILSMTAELARRGDSFRVVYLAAGRSAAALADELAEHASQGRLTFAFEGRRTPGFSLEATLGAHCAGRHVYVCGPAGLIQAVRDATRAWPAGSVHFESFAAAPAAANGAGRPFEVTLASSGASYTVPPGRTILEVLEENGAKPACLCREGNCGTCLVRVVEGTPDHRDTVLSDEERASNTEIAICCSRSMTSRLVIDL